jgi:hypothetical protein
MKIEGSGYASGSESESGSISQRLAPRIRIRIHTKMLWIRNTADNDLFSMHISGEQLEQLTGLCAILRSG